MTAVMRGEGSAIGTACGDARHGRRRRSAKTPRPGVWVGGGCGDGARGWVPTCSWRAITAAVGPVVSPPMACRERAGVGVRDGGRWPVITVL